MSNKLRQLVKYLASNKLFEPMLLGASLLAIVLSLQIGLNNKTSINSQPIANKKTLQSSTVKASPKTATTKTATPLSVTPKAVTTPAPAAVTKPAVTHVAKPAPVVTPAPGSSVSGLTPSSPSTPSSGSSPSPNTGSSTPTTSSYTSTNWSGYLAASSSYTAVSASWTATSPLPEGYTTSADSTWIGIGGVTSDDLIQVGTQNIVEPNGQVLTAAFYEMLPAASVNISTMTVHSGDSISASISEVSSGVWSISITDNTDSQSYSSTVSYASSLSSAEWVEEDPSYTNYRLIPFDNFQTASFSDTSTVANGTTDNLMSADAQQITMVNAGDQTIAATSAIGSDDESFSVSREDS